MADHDAGSPKGTIDRAFAILRCFREDDTAGLGVTELAQRSGLSKTTTHRLLASLVRNKVLIKAGSKYRLGPLFDQSSHSPYPEETALIAEVLTPFLAALFERTRQTVHLGSLDGTDIIYANKLFSFRGPRTPSRVGGRVPGYCTAVGKAILAYDDAAIEASLARGLAPWTPHTITDPAKFKEELALVRETGLAYDREEIMLGLSCVAAPIFGQGPVPVAAMSVSGDAATFRPRDHEATLLRITHAASKKFAQLLRAQRERTHAPANLATAARLHRAGTPWE